MLINISTKRKEATKMSKRFYRVKLKDQPPMLVEAQSPALAWFRVTEPDVTAARKNDIPEMMKAGCRVVLMDESEEDK